MQWLTTQEVTKSAPCDHEEYIHYEEEKIWSLCTKGAEDWKHHERWGADDSSWL